MPASEIVALVAGIIGCATSLATVAPRLGPPLAKYYAHLREKLSYLADNERKLKAICDESRKLEQLRYQYDWMDDNRTIGEIQDLDMHVCLEYRRWHLPNYYKRYILGRRIAELTVRLNELMNDFQVAQGQWDSGALKYFGSGSDLVGSQAMEACEEISTLILDDYVSVIGVFGAIGIGKTKVVATICKRIVQRYMSVDALIWVEASYEDDLKKLQMKLASKIGLSLPSDDTVLQNAALLRSSLMEKGEFLIVLDNLCKAYSLEEIGVPATIHGRRSTTIIISRSSSVCSQMNSGKIIGLKLLSDEEAYELLTSKITEGNDSTLTEETQSILKNVAEESGGLPLAIIMVARHLRKLNWNDCVIIEKALKSQLAAFREPTMNSKYIDDKVFENFFLSYEHLKYSNYSCIQECFLYCTLYPRNTAILAKELMEYWIWEGLLDEVEQIDKKLGRAEEILDELKKACLLNSIGYENGVEIVKLHPFIWDMAVQIIDGSPGFLIKAGRRLRKPLYRDWPEDVERVSLMRNEIKELRCGPNFCKLSTLLLQYNPIDIQIHNAFFNSIPNLRILDLSNTGLRILPESLSCLKNLSALLLRNCWALTSLPSLSELLGLIVLDISGSPIAQLPSDISSELMRLDLSRTRVRNFPHNLLTQLYNLQELLMIGCDFRWISQSRIQDNRVAAIKDIEELECLSVLEITFSEMQIFQDYISSRHWRQLKSFKFCVGGLYNGKLGNNSLAFIKEFPSDPIFLPDNALELLVMHCGEMIHLTMPRFRHLKIMDISYCAKLKYLFKVEVLKNLQNLKEIVVAQCADLEKLIEQDDEGPSPRAETITLPSLQKLTLFSLPKLQLISHIEIECDSLQTIAVWNCSKLQKFPVLLQIEDIRQKLKTPHDLKEVTGERSWLENLEQCPSDALAILQKLFVEKSPPEELISRGRMMNTSG